ncbi:hypothetical protein FQZ97_1051300 [compost metagenome]
MNTGSRADIDHIVSCQDGIFVMLNDDNRIAEIAQMAQRVEKTGIVALMQADRRLIKNIKHTRKARTDLRSQADALAFTAR